MKQEYVKPWCEALTSGQFKQTTRMLHNSEGYCCLGVACEIYQDNKQLFDVWQPDKIYNTNNPEDCFTFFEGKVDLPQSVWVEFGMNSSHGVFKLPAPFTFRSTSRHSTSLANLNDESFSFAMIADIIRYFWKEL